jgi:hypothetical protein
MTQAPDESGEMLRRVLRAEAESFVPSAEGLEIIRTRIDQRGMRGVFWWRAAASTLGAVLVAATVVMVVPNLREQFTPDQHPIVQVEFTTAPPDGSSTRRPWTNTPSSGGTQHAVPGTTTSVTPSTMVSPTPLPSPGNDCATAIPSPSEPEALESGSPCAASPSPTGSTPDETTRPRPSQKPTPAPTLTPTKAPPNPPTPTATTTPDTCQDCTPSPTASPPPSVTPQMTTEGTIETVPSETA